MTPQQQKDTLRQTMRQKRQALSRHQLHAAGLAIAAHLNAPPLNLFNRFRNTCVYLSTPHEIPTRYIVHHIHTSGSASVPGWSATDRRYLLYSLPPGAPFTIGHHGIREPVIRTRFPIWEVDAFILPGLAFDRHGARLGYGAGHYDQILAEARQNALKIAICHSWQITDTPIPQEPHDIRVHHIVTENGTLTCSPPPPENPHKPIAQPPPPPYT